MRKYALFVLQILGLWLINKAGYWIVDFFHIPLPGNVMGMIILFFLLITRVVKIEWIEHGAGFLNKHLAFFFIPIAVGLMEYGDLILTSGWALATVLFGSSIIGFACTGGLSQLLAKKKITEEEGEKVHERHHVI
ncbi:MAG TPA: CidA/LrgA family protein [Chondromyces sp.]|nr:CidA/LrgA family protein [Chondromyces sp.]